MSNFRDYYGSSNINLQVIYEDVLANNLWKVWKISKNLKIKNVVLRIWNLKMRCDFFSFSFFFFIIIIIFLLKE